MVAGLGAIKMHRIMFAALAGLLAATSEASAQNLGNYSANRYDQSSTTNPYGAGNPYDPNSINNRYGQYGSPYSNRSVDNPYATNAPQTLRPRRKLPRAPEQQPLMIQTRCLIRMAATETGFLRTASTIILAPVIPTLRIAPPIRMGMASRSRVMTTTEGSSHARSGNRDAVRRASGLRRVAAGSRYAPRRSIRGSERRRSCGEVPSARKFLHLAAREPDNINTDQGSGIASTRFCKVSVIASKTGVLSQLNTEDSNAGAGLAGAMGMYGSICANRLGMERQS